MFSMLITCEICLAFVDANTGPYCNESTMKGFQEVSTALYVVQTLNKYDYVPGLSLGEFLSQVKSSKSTLPLKITIVYHDK